MTGTPQAAPAKALAEVAGGGRVAAGQSIGAWLPAVLLLSAQSAQGEAACKRPPSRRLCPSCSEVLGRTMRALTLALCFICAAAAQEQLGKVSSPSPPPPPPPPAATATSSPLRFPSSPSVQTTIEPERPVWPDEFRVSADGAPTLHGICRHELAMCDACRCSCSAAGRRAAATLWLTRANLPETCRSAGTLRCPTWPSTKRRGSRARRSPRRCAAPVAKSLRLNQLALH